jgi:hypothetical protein
VGKRVSLIIVTLFALAGCAGSREAVSHPDDYVEIDNPAFTMSPNAPSTIWVPRSYVEKGVPRGGELIEQGVDKIRGQFAGNGAQQQPPTQPPAQAQPVAPAPAVMAAPVVKNRIFVVEAGKIGIIGRFVDELRNASVGTVIDSARSAVVARYAAAGSAAERSALAIKLQEDFGANLVMYLAAPEGVDAGKIISVEIYEAQGGSFVRRLETPVPANAGRIETALAAALGKLAVDAKEVSTLIPWYGRVVAVEGERVYLNAGKETGIGAGMRMNLFRNGKVVEKIGFAPGQKIGILEVRGHVGTDGAYAVVKEGGTAQVSDLVSVE